MDKIKIAKVVAAGCLLVLAGLLVDEWWTRNYAYDHHRYMTRIKQTRWNDKRTDEEYFCKGSTCEARAPDWSATYDCGTNPCR